MSLSRTLQCSVRAQGQSLAPFFRRFASTSSSSYTSSESQSLQGTPKPPLKTWYTGRPALSALLQELSNQVKETRQTLYRSGIIESFSADVKPEGQKGIRWLAADAIGTKDGLGKVRLAYYRRITSLLSELHSLVPLLAYAGSQSAESHAKLSTMLQQYIKPDSRVENGQGTKKKGYGYTDLETKIAYGLGRKKTASARAWILPLQPKADASQQESQSAGLLEEEPIGSILINGMRLTKYFTDVAHRTVITRPMKLTETLGKYNVYVLIQGGGYSSKSVAASVAIARALASLGDVSVTGTSESLESAVSETGLAVGAARQILSKADLLRRDPRVVERKKTGRPKARKRFTWVKR